MATAVLVAVQDVFDSQAEQSDIGISDNAWHGGCLAVAELTRHRLVPGSFLQTFVPHVLRVSLVPLLSLKAFLMGVLCPGPKFRCQAR